MAGECDLPIAPSHSMPEPWMNIHPITGIQNRTANANVPAKTNRMLFSSSPRLVATSERPNTRPDKAPSAIHCISRNRQFYNGFFVYRSAKREAISSPARQERKRVQCVVLERISFNNGAFQAVLHAVISVHVERSRKPHANS